LSGSDVWIKGCYKCVSEQSIRDAECIRTYHKEIVSTCALVRVYL
jgi:hypothetical protein